MCGRTLRTLIVCVTTVALFSIIAVGIIDVLHGREPVALRAVLTASLGYLGGLITRISWQPDESEGRK